MARPSNSAKIKSEEEEEATKSKTAIYVLPEIGTICRVCREIGKFEVSKMLSF